MSQFRLISEQDSHYTQQKLGRWHATKIWWKPVFPHVQKELWVICIWYNREASIFSYALTNPAGETKTVIQEIALNRKSLLDLLNSSSLIPEAIRQRSHLSIFHCYSQKPWTPNAAQSERILKISVDRRGEEINTGLTLQTWSQQQGRQITNCTAEQWNLPGGQCVIPWERKGRKSPRNSCLTPQLSAIEQGSTVQTWTNKSLQIWRDQDQHFPLNIKE